MCNQQNIKNLLSSLYGDGKNIVLNITIFSILYYTLEKYNKLASRIYINNRKLMKLQLMMLIIIRGLYEKG